MHVAIYLSPSFYSAIASSVVETLEAVNAVSGAPLFSFEFISKQSRTTSKSGIRFPGRPKPSRKMDLLFLLAGASTEESETLEMLETELPHVKPLIELAQQQGAVIAATCGAPYFLAASGALDGKRSTISWWLKKAASERFPKVRWQPARLVVRQGRVYTSGAGFAGIDLLMTLLVDLGFAKEASLVRKLMALPPLRTFQSPYEIPTAEDAMPFEQKLNELSSGHLRELSLAYLAGHLGMSARTLSRRFDEELKTSPGRWIQDKRLEHARSMLEETRLPVSQICRRVGYEDLASFSRLFSRTTGMTPGEFRKHLQS